MDNQTGRKKVIRILIAAIVAVAIVIAAMSLLREHQNRFADYFDRIEVAYQESNGIRTTNYIALLKDGVVWSDSVDREEIAAYVVKAAREEAEAVEASHYNIIGRTADNKILFMYNKQEGTLLLYGEDGNPSEVVKYK